MSKFYISSNESEQNRELRLAEKVKEENASGDLGRQGLIQLLDVVEHGISDVYGTFEEFIFDFWFDLSWDPDGQRKDIQTILADSRFEDVVCPAILKEWCFDVKEEFQKALSDEE